MSALAHVAGLTAPLFILVLLGFALARWGDWPKPAADALTRFVFTVAIPAFLFRLMSDFSALPPVDARLLIAYFGGCLVTFGIARLIAARLFRLDGVGQSVFGLGTVFSNNVLLGVPFARVTLGEAAMPVVSLVLIFNALLLWTLVAVSVEWARNRDLSLRGFGRTAMNVVTNPVVSAIIAGTAFGFTGLKLPTFVDGTLAIIGEAAVPMSLIVLGMGLAEYVTRAAWGTSAAITAIKLLVLPLAVWLLAQALGLPALETRVVVVLAALPVGANVYLMARQYEALEGPVASSLVLSTALAAFTTPILLLLLA